jgi:DNA-binding transcriptional ArsR family regulator
MLANFRAGRSLGPSVAALKVLVAIFLRAENKRPNEATVTQGSASLSYDDLMELTGLSRSMIRAGTLRLRSVGLITVTQEGKGRRNRYFVNGYSTGAWGKLPYRKIAGKDSAQELRLLHELSCKRVADLNALKLYMLLGAHRAGGSPYAMIGYDKIEKATGIVRARIRSAISILIEHGLVQVENEKIPGQHNTPNRYQILGL